MSISPTLPTCHDPLPEAKVLGTFNIRGFRAIRVSCAYCPCDHVHVWRNGHDPLVLPSRCGAGEYVVPMIV